MQDVYLNIKIMKIQIKKYDLDIKNKSDAEAYNVLCKQLKNKGYKLFDVITSEILDLSKLPVDHIVDLGYMFDNQFNTIGEEGKKGLRLHDWYEKIYPNKNLKRGYYVENIQDLNEYRKTICKCGYCGKQYKVSDNLDFCTKCLGGEYLTLEYLPFLNLTPLLSKKENKNVSDELLNAYKEAQIKAKFEGSESYKAKLIQRAKESIDKHTFSTNTTLSLKIQLLELGFAARQDNIIFYPHSNEVALNWSSINPFTSEEIELIKSKMKLPEGVTFK